MSAFSIVKLLLVFGIAFSLASLAGPMSGTLHLPTVQLANAVPEPCQTHGSSGACAQFWYPAGPAMNTELATIYTDEVAEYTALQTTPSPIDLTDWQLAPGLVSTFNTSPSFYITAPLGELGYYEIQFHLANNFWGCNFSFGNSACGVQIRQGIAHMVDKTSFANNEPSIAGTATPIDNAVPTTSLGGLPSPNPCGYDTAFPQTGSQCVVGAVGGTAYHLGAATGANGSPWLYAPGSADLNAAAQHFVTAGVATGFNSGTSVLTGISGAAASNVPNFFVRNDNAPRLSFGNTLAAQMCYLFTGSYSTPCTYLTVTRGPITAFPGFTTSTTGVNLNWWMYTAAYLGPTFFDGSLYFAYNSNFVSGVPSIVSPTGQCSNTAVPTAAASDYMYLCSAYYDALSYQMETAPCLSAPGDPTTGNAIATLGLCAGSSSLTSTLAVTSGAFRTILQGGTVTLPITVTSINGFSGSVSLTATVNNSTITTNRPTTSLSPTSVSLTPGTPIHGGSTAGTTQSTLTVHTVSSTKIGAWNITITGTSGSQTSSTHIYPHVISSTSSGVNEDWSGFLFVPAGLSESQKVNFTTVNGFSGTGTFSDSFNGPGPTGDTMAVNPGTIAVTPATSGAATVTATNKGVTAASKGDPLVPKDCLIASVAADVFGPESSVGVDLACFLASGGLLSAISAGVQAEDTYGAGVYTLPMFELTVQYGYLNNGWQRVINNAGLGEPNYFTWLNAWNPSPVQAGTLRQGFKETTRSVNPYIASTVWDTYVMGNIYDSLYASNPLAPAQLINWMTESTAQLSNSSLIYNGGLTGAPAHTRTTYRFTLRPDLFFQDGRPVTSYDVAFSYLSMVGTGAFLGTGASTMSGVTILNPNQFDIGVSSVGPFELSALTAIPIVSGRYWTNAGTSTWDSQVSACTTSTCADVQYVLSGPTPVCAGACTSFPATTMTINPANVVATYDPIASHTLVGSGPWQCGTVTSSGSGSCSSTGTQNPPTGGSYTLTRFGNGLAPASSISGIYFRSSGDLALYLWSEQNDVNPLLAFVAVASCYQVAVNLAGACGHFQQGIGNPGSGTTVGVSQVSVSSRFYNLNWLAPFEWATNPPTGIGALPPVLYEGSVTLNPASSVGCPNGYDC